MFFSRTPVVDGIVLSCMAGRTLSGVCSDQVGHLGHDLAYRVVGLFQELVPADVLFIPFLELQLFDPAVVNLEDIKYV